MSSTNAFSYDQTMVMRKAIDFVVNRLNDSSLPRRQEVARVVLGLFNDRDFDAPEALAMSAIEKLGGEAFLAAE
jgi:hypothetical protein